MIEDFYNNFRALLKGIVYVYKTKKLSENLLTTRGFNAIIIRLSNESSPDKRTETLKGADGKTTIHIRVHKQLIKGLRNLN